MKEPRVLCFDVNETLLDLAPLRTSIGAVLGGREELLPLWFSTLLHYSLVDTLTEDYRPFAEIGVAALRMLGERYGVDIDRASAQKAIAEPLRTLPPHPDVRPSLARLAQAGYQLVSLTNSSTSGVAAQFESAGISHFFDRRISTEEVRAFKPDPRPYRHMLSLTAAPAGEVLMVAAHAWDLAGAKRCGMRTAFVRREGATLYPNVARPDYVVESLTELCEELLASRA